MNAKFCFHLLRMTALIGVGGLLCTSAKAMAADAEQQGGEAWSRIIRHFDGTQTKSVKEGGKNQISEEKYDENHVLVAKRLFMLDARGRLRNGVIMDAKGKALGSTEYGYNKYDVINEERLFDAKGQLIQRKFPPGSLGIPQNARHTIVYTIDPKNPKAAGTMRVTDDELIRPVTNPEDNFTPGIPLGKPAPKGANDTGLPVADTPVPSTKQGRRPMSLFRQKNP